MEEEAKAKTTDKATDTTEKLGDSITEDDVGTLQRVLSDIDWEEANAAAEEGRKQGYFYLLLYELNRTKLHIYANEGSHQTPHFHIEYKREHSAAYEILTLTRIVGDMPRKYERPILDWARLRRNALMRAWQEVAVNGRSFSIEESFENDVGE
jgi:hypothetical protein